MQLPRVTLREGTLILGKALEVERDCFPHVRESLLDGAAAARLSWSVKQ
jgi:hypothetical protein